MWWHDVRRWVRNSDQEVAAEGIQEDGAMGQARVDEARRARLLRVRGRRPQGHARLRHVHEAGKTRPGETVFFSFIIFKSKAHRNAVNKRVMAEMSEGPTPPDMPFVPRRMAYGGFRTIVQG
jgi:hypothetical protein